MQGENQEINKEKVLKKKKLVFTKGEYVKNPKTGRQIKVGGRTYLKMLKEGVIKDPEYIDPTDLGEYDEQKFKTLKKTMAPTKFQPAKGRGRLKGRMVKRYKKNVGKIDFIRNEEYNDEELIAMFKKITPAQLDRICRVDEKEELDLGEELDEPLDEVDEKYEEDVEDYGEDDEYNDDPLEEDDDNFY